MKHQTPNQTGLPQRWVVMGVSGCGKSAIGILLADRLGIEHFEGDSDHPPENIEKMSAGIPLADNDRQGWLLLLQARLKRAADHGRGLVLSCSALKRHYRDLLRAADPGLVFVHLTGERELIATRMQARPNHFMPVALLDSQFQDLEPLQPDERGIELDIEMPPQQLMDHLLDQATSRFSTGEPEKD